MISTKLFEQLRTAAVTAAAIVFAGISFSSVAVASTPDGETPANEGVCDVLQGGTPGLYGLCVAYCEAQDLDSFEKSPPNVKILANYRKKMNAGDPDMPCLQVPCPCVSAEELASLTADGTAAACVRFNGKIQLTDNNVALPKFADADTNANRCRYIDLNVAPPTIRNLQITADEAASCYSQIDNACVSVGL